jgi:hypothetical protein
MGGAARREAASGDVLVDDEEEHSEADQFPLFLALRREHSNNKDELHD